jgi:hypothetical protein
MRLVFNPLTGLFDFVGGKWSDISGRPNSTPAQIDSAIARESLALATGVIDPGVISIGTPNTTISISAGSSLYVDTSDINNVSVEVLTWDDFSNITPPSLDTAGRLWIGIERLSAGVGGLVFSTEFTATQRRTIAILGRVWGNGTTVVEGFGQYSTPAYGVGKTLEDILTALGSLNISGNVFAAHGGNLKLDKTGGQSFRFAANTSIDPNSPNICTDDSVVNLSAYHYHTALGGYVTELETTIDPEHYDVAGTKTAVTAGKWTIQEVYHYPGSGGVDVLYGQKLYDTLNDAVDGISNDSIIINAGNATILQGAVLRAWVVVKQGTTDLADVSKAKIVPANSMFGGGAGGGTAGEINTGSNVGTIGVGVFNAKVGVDLEFKNVAAASSKLIVTDDPTHKAINLDLGTVTVDDLSDGTTYKRYSDTEKTKLAGIESGADVTDASNVASAGALMAKTPITGATKTKITYNNDGLVTSGADATQDDIGDGTIYKRYSDTEKTKLAGIEAGANNYILPSTLSADIIVDGTTNKAYTTDDNKSSTDVLSTGLVSGGALSVNVGDNTKFDIAAGVGIIIDLSVVGSPSRERIVWSDRVGISDPYVSSADTSYVSINAAGQVVVTAESPSLDAQRNIILIGWLDHPGRTVIEGGKVQPVFVGNVASQLNDFLVSFGSFNISGNEYAALSGLSVLRSAGTTFEADVNYYQNINNPNIFTTGIESPVSIYYYYRDGSGGWINEVLASVIDPEHWDDNSGILAAVPSEKFTIQVIAFYASTGSNDFQYGQVVYDDMASAKSALQQRVDFNPYNAYDTFRGWLIVQQGTTDLTDVAKAQFIPAGKLGIIDVSSGGGTGGEINTASNIGLDGVGFYNDKLGVDLQFKNIAPDLTTSLGSKLTITDNPTNKTVDIGLDSLSAGDVGAYSKGETIALAVALS